MHLYLHVPFCARRCSYCDFAIAVRRQVPSRSYAEAIIREWEGWQKLPVWVGGDTIETIYFGGGTPSLLDPHALEQILESIQSHRPVAANAELTIEVNPDDVSVERAEKWRTLGLNRVSLGVQSFDPAALAWMHRTHTADDVPRSVDTLRNAGFRNISLDLIFALPPHLNRDWQRDLELAFALEPQHLSLYGLTVEEHTPLARWVARGETIRTDDESYAREFLLADSMLRSKGYEHYEISNSALPGFRSRHNSAYWRRRPFIGLGPSAHSGFGRERRWNIRDWGAYEPAVLAGATALEGKETLDDVAIALEDVYLGLRTVEGVAPGSLPPSAVEGWIAQGWAVRTDDRLSLTVEGWLRLDALVGSLPPNLLQPIHGYPQKT